MRKMLLAFEPFAPLFTPRDEIVSCTDEAAFEAVASSDSIPCLSLVVSNLRERNMLLKYNNFSRVGKVSL